MSVIPLFEGFLRLSDSSASDPCTVYRMKYLVYTIIRRFMKGDIVNNYLSDKLKNLDIGVNNQLNDEDFVLGGERQTL